MNTKIIPMNGSQSHIDNQLRKMNCSNEEIRSASDQVQLAQQNMIQFERIRNVGKMNFIAEATKFFRPRASV